MKKTVLVVGGAGFIGSQVNKMLQKAGYNTLVFDNLSRGNPETVIAGTFIKGDIENLPVLESLFKDHRIDAVMDFAAYIDVGESVKNPAIYYRNNVSNTLNLLDAMIAHGVKYFIFSSSAAIFGLPQEESITESHPCHPINPYGESKLMIEKILRDYTKAYPLKACCLRYFNAAGGDPDKEIKNHRKNETNVIPRLLHSLQQPKTSFTLFGTDYSTPDGTCIRDYVHVYDLGIAHILAMENLFNSKEKFLEYNLGNGKGFSVRDVINVVEKVTGENLKVVEGARREGDPSILLANSKKAEQELGWKPQYPRLEEMVKDAWEAMQETGIRSQDSGDRSPMSLS